MLGIEAEAGEADQPGLLLEQQFVAQEIAHRAYEGEASVRTAADWARQQENVVLFPALEAAAPGAVLQGLLFRRLSF